MTRLSRATLVALCTVFGCGSSAPGTSTEARIEVEEVGGFIPTLVHRRVQLMGTAAMYTASMFAGEATISSQALADVVDALDDAQFLDLPADFGCPGPAPDHTTVTIEVSLPEGSNTVVHDKGCVGARFEEIEALEEQIFSLSGFSAWLAAQ